MKKKKYYPQWKKNNDTFIITVSAFAILATLFFIVGFREEIFEWIKTLY